METDTLHRLGIKLVHLLGACCAVLGVAVIFYAAFIAPSAAQIMDDRIKQGRLANAANLEVMQKTLAIDGHSARSMAIMRYALALNEQVISQHKHEKHSGDEGLALRAETHLARLCLGKLFKDKSESETVARRVQEIVFHDDFLRARNGYFERDHQVLAPNTEGACPASLAAVVESQKTPWHEPVTWVSLEIPGG